MPVEPIFGTLDAAVKYLCTSERYRTVHPEGNQGPSVDRPVGFE